MKLGEKIKVLADMPGMGITKLHSIGASYALIIPKFWVHMNCTQVDGDYYIQFKQVDGGLLFTAIDTDVVKKIKVKPK